MIIKQFAQKNNKEGTIRYILLLTNFHVKFPSSFAVLVNYGVHGHKTKLYSSWIHNDRCKTNEIWDPFNNQCRRLYCRDGNHKFQDDNCVYNKDDPKPVIEFLDSLSKFINITLDFSTIKRIDKNWIVHNGDNIINEFRNKFAAKWGMNMNHLVNISIEYLHENSLSINFLILDNRKNIIIFNNLSHRIIFNQSEQYELQNIWMTAVAIHSIVSELKNFCLNITDMPLWYWNSEFAFITRDDQTYLYVNGTGRLYQTDTMIESILSTTLMFISIIMLTLLLITFIRFDQIRRSINGFNSINLAISLEMMQLLFLSNQFIQNCRIVAVLFHFFILSTISWSSVIAYEMYRVFITTKLVTRTLSNRSQNKIRLRYGLVGYISTFSIIIVANVGDIFNLEPIKGDYGRLELTEVCWMRRTRATIYYFIIPATVAIIYNLLLYVRIVCNIRHDLKSVPLGFTWIIALILIIISQDVKNLILTRIISYAYITRNCIILSHGSLH
ncbi:hypothetical protein HUG17_9759 [Dermatophagoides farinae]|uniref:G-protein coupled receptors family 2 profile 2 domain-containing protein n=1 Tax=Dermatophagoides farinae TaxID=6954 RepID=A0A9D4P306_DERFA|nr:hypothetical protein HUG17_9759 [Dermatophagoides farinae]